MSLVIIILGLSALIAWTLYATGVFENGALFFAVGALPGSDAEVDPTLMLGLHAVLLVLVGYIFGFMHGSLHRAVQHHLKHTESKPTEAVAVAQPELKKATSPERQTRAYLKQWVAWAGKHARTHSTRVKHAGSKGYAQARRYGVMLLAVAGAMAVWALPRIVVLARRTMRYAGHAAKKTVEVIEKIWVWFRYP